MYLLNDRRASIRFANGFIHDRDVQSHVIKGCRISHLNSVVLALWWRLRRRRCSDAREPEHGRLNLLLQRWLLDSSPMASKVGGGARGGRTERKGEEFYGDVRRPLQYTEYIN
jgi:hypothetical protein